MIFITAEGTVENLAVRSARLRIGVAAGDRRLASRRLCVVRAPAIGGRAGFTVRMVCRERSMGHGCILPVTEGHSLCATVVERTRRQRRRSSRSSSSGSVPSTMSRFPGDMLVELQSFQQHAKAPARTEQNEVSVASGPLMRSCMAPCTVRSHRRSYGECQLVCWSWRVSSGDNLALLQACSWSVNLTVDQPVYLLVCLCCLRFASEHESPS